MPTGTGVRRTAGRRVPDETALGQEDRDALDDVGLPPCHCSHGLVGDPPDAVTIHEAVALVSIDPMLGM